MKKMMRYFCVAAAALLCTVLLLLPCAAEGEDDGRLLPAPEMPEGIDDFLAAVPDEVTELLPDGFFSGDAAGMSDALRRASSADYLINTALGIVGGGIGDALRSFCTLVGLALAAAVLGCVRESLPSRGMAGALELAVNTAAAVAAVGTQYLRFEAVGTYFERQRMIMSSLLPLMGVLYAMGGNSGGAVLNNSTVLLWLELIDLFATALLMPAVAVMTALSLAGAFLPGVRTSGLSKFIGKTVGTVLGLAAVLLGTALGAQNVLTASGDKLGFRTAKFVAGSMIPVVGSTVGDSLRTLAASVGMLRSTVGVSGIVVLILLLLPTLLSLLLSRLSFSAAAGVADMLGSGELARFYRDMSSVYGLLIAAAALSALMFVFALTVFALTAAATA